MKTREEALKYGLSFPNTYQEAPFRDPNWQLVRVKKSKKAFLWTYEKDGYAFGGAWKQGQILESEGVEVVDGKVNLEKYRIKV